MMKSPNQHSNFFRAFCVVLGLFLCLSNSYAFKEKDADLSLFNHDHYPLEPHIEIFEDTSAKLSIEDILAKEDSIGFVKNERKHINYSFTSSAIWLRVDLDYPVHSSNKAPHRTWYLEIDRTYLDTCELYIIDDNNQYIKLKADQSVRQEDRAIQSPTSVFPIDFEIGERKKLYVKIQTIHTLYFQVNLWRPEAYTKHSTIQQLSYGFFYGGMAIVILYNLFLFFSTRDINYLLYISYMTSITLLEFIELGHGLQVTGFLQDILHKKHIPSIGWYCWASILLFTMTYLETKKNHPFFHFVIQRLVIILIFNILIDPYMSYQTSVFAVVFFSSICLILVPAMSLYSWMKGNPNGEYFTYAIFASISGITLYCLVTMDILPSTKGIISLFSLGLLAESLLFSLAIGNRINRARAEALKANQETLDNLSRYQSLFENAKEGLYQVDLKGRLIRSNRSLATILGFSDTSSLSAASETATHSFFDASGFSPENENQAIDHRSEFSFINEAKKKKWVNHSTKLLRNNLNEPIAYEGIVIDITDTKEREDAQKASKEEAYRNELAHKESLETTNFLANMSYRIRSSLTNILGFAEVQNLDTVSEKQKHEKSLKALNLSQRLLLLINKILDFSKLEAKKMELEEIESDVASILNECLSPLGNTKHSVNYKYPLPVKAISDPIRLNQCIYETILFCSENSIQSGCNTNISFDSKNSTLLVDLTFESDQSFNDKNLFDTFKVEDAWLKTSSSDAGLGLALAFKISNLLGGELTYTAKKNLNQIKLALPLALPESPAFFEDERARLKALEPKANTDTSTQNLSGKVLVAEDNVVNQKLINKLLSKVGLDVVIAANGQEALEAALQQHFDAVLMDLNMPIMDGFEATESLLNKSYTSPIFALTAENDPEMIARCEAAGFKGYLEKPVKRKQIIEALAPYLTNNTEK